MSVPYKSHPLYVQRFRLLLIACFSVICGFISILSTRYSQALWIGHIFWTLCSLFICAYDLVIWHAGKDERATENTYLPRHRDGNESDPQAPPRWPLKVVMVVDLILALFMMFWYWSEIVDYDGSWYYDRRNQFSEAYASLGILAGSLTHGYCFWKQLMAIKEVQWRAVLLAHQGQLQCPSCFQGDDVGETIIAMPPGTTTSAANRADVLVPFPWTGQQPHNHSALSAAAIAAARTAQTDADEPYAGRPAAATGSTNLMTPSTSASTTTRDAEDDGPYSGSGKRGYGTMARPEAPHILPFVDETYDDDDDVVVAKITTVHHPTAYEHLVHLLDDEAEPKPSKEDHSTIVKKKKRSKSSITMKQNGSSLK